MTLSKFLRTGAAALGALAVASVSQANAADLYAGGMKEAPAYIPPPFWTGFYIGGHLGAAWERFDFNRHEFDDNLKDANWDGVIWRHHNAILNPERRSDGDAFGGVQFGYNFQSPGAFVYGIEVDLGGMALNTRARARDNTFWDNGVGGVRMGTPVEFDGDNQGGFYGDVTGRLGWTWGPAMVYGKGGFAFLNANLRQRERVFDSGQWGTPLCGSLGWCDFNRDNNNTLTGWTAGGGVEWKVSPLWSIKVEYLHFQFDNFNNNCCNDFANWDWAHSNNFNNHANLQVDTVKLGFNYFWSPIPAPAPLK